MKKKNAIMIADTRSALIGNLLVQLQETNEGLFEEAIIYYEKLDNNDKKVIEKIMPCRFIKFDYHLPDSVSKLPAFDKFSPLMFARYYMFDLLDEYETITWIDTDVLITGKLDPIIEKARINGMSANFEDKENKSYKNTDTMRTSFIRPMSEYDMTKYNMSSGLITVCDNLKNYKEMTKWCFEKTIEYADNFVLPDQAVLNMLIQDYDIDVACVGEHGAYCFYPSYNRDASKAKIVHAWGARKFWRSWYLFKTYPKWYEYYQKWLKLGGSDIFGEIKPDISVVIPTYKTKGDYFELVLKDLLIEQVQEHGFPYDNFEIVIVVDGTENADLLRVLKKYKDPRINLIMSNERNGIAKSINIGIKAAKADFIARIDDDDRVDRERLYLQYKYLKEHNNIDLVTSNFEYFGDMQEERISFQGEMSKAWSIFTCPFNHPTIMFRKEFFLKNKLLYDENRSHVEDWELWLRCFDKGMKVGNIDKVLYYHRWHNGSAGQNTKTIDMMRELVRLNFAKLDVKLTQDDLKIVPPWNGKVNEKELEKLKNIFALALNNNLIAKKYDQRCLEKVFKLRLFEAENGYMKDIVIKKNTPIAVNQKPQKDSIKKKMLRPFYKPFKRVFYNIMAEAVNDNVIYLQQNNKYNELKKDFLNIFNSLEEHYQMNDTVFEHIQETQEGLMDVQQEIKNQTILNHDNLYDFHQEFKFLKNAEISNLYMKKKVILIGTPEHHNIGDGAITMGEYEFIRSNYNDRTLIEFSTYEFEDNFKYLASIINPDDIIFLQGGGNMGERYIVEENLRRKVVESFPGNKIVILPQTIYFEDENELEKSKKVYNAHPNLTIFVRGEESLKFANKHFNNCNNHCTFDMAMYLNFNYQFDRNSLLYCIRDITDESNLSEKEYNEILSIIKKIDKNADYTNNIYDGNIYKEYRSKIVTEQLMNFAKHKVVVTDRLHGLIFSVITNTPCVVLKSYNQKIEEYVKMLDNNNIIYIDKDIKKIENSIQFLMNSKTIKNNYKQDLDKIIGWINEK